MFHSTCSITTLVVFLFCCCVPLAPANAFFFKIDSGEDRCFQEDLTDTRYVLTYSMSRGLAAVTSITVTSSGQEESIHPIKLMERSPALEEESVVIYPTRPGSFAVCFVVSRKASVLTSGLTIDYELDTEHNVLKRESTGGHEVVIGAQKTSIEQAEYIDKVLTILEDSYSYFHEMESKVRDTNESTNSYVMVLTVVAILSIVVIAVAGEMRLKKFLQKKKFLD